MELFRYLLPLILCACVASTEKTEASNSSYEYLQLVRNLPYEFEVSQLIGLERGTIGTERIPVAIVPKDSQTRTDLTDLYTKIGNSTAEEDMIIVQRAQVDRLTKLHESLASEDGKILLKAYIRTMPQLRQEYVTFACLRMVSFPSYQAYVERKPEKSIDTFQTCPNSCARRELPHLLNYKAKYHIRYMEPCSYPLLYSPYKSRMCINSPNGFFTHREGYECECTQGAKWLSQSKVCAFVGNTNQTGCDKRGTMYIAHVSAEVQSGGDLSKNVSHHVERCVCKEQYYGTRCDKPKDPCTMSIGEALPGNVACAVQHGNTCFKHPRNFKYTCKCTDKYGPLPMQSLPKGRLMDNCLRQMNPCSVQACVHGTCVLSDHGSIMEQRGRYKREPYTWLGRTPAVVARCLCNSGWTGEKCEHPLVLNSWTPWSPWSTCEPACQTSFKQMPPSATQEMVPVDQMTPRWGIRQRTRYRDCIGQSSDCRQELQERSADMGLSIEDGETWRQFERRACRPRPCDRHLFLAMGKRAVRRSKIQKQVRQTLEQAYTVYFWMVLAFTFLFSVFAFLAAFATKMFNEKLYESGKIVTRST